MTTFAKPPVDAQLADENGQVSRAWRAFIRGLAEDQSRVGDYMQTLRTDVGGGWLLCDGSAVKIDDYPGLYKLMNGQINNPTPSTFKLPKIDPVYDPAHPAPDGPPLYTTWVRAI